MNRQQLQQYLANQNVRKFLDFISLSEGTAPFSNPYLAAGGTNGLLLATGYKTHPALLGHGIWEFKDKSGNTLKSTANGRYAIKKATWQGVNRALGGNLTFSPEDQDLAAVWLINNRGALKDVANGNLQSAITKLGNEWASLPTAPASYNQHFNKWNDIGRMLVRAGLNPASAGLKGQYQAWEYKPWGDRGTAPMKGTGQAATFTQGQSAKAPPQQMAQAPATPTTDALSGQPQGVVDLSPQAIQMAVSNQVQGSPLDYMQVPSNAWRKGTTLDVLGGF